MTVQLLHHTPLWVCAMSIRKCWASEDKSDTTDDMVIGHYLDYDYIQYCDEAGPRDKELIHRVGNKNKHSSTLEHLNYSFDIDGISRACLQELARHRHTSLSVKSTRYTLKELKNDNGFNKYLVSTGDEELDEAAVDQLIIVQQALQGGYSNDKVKYLLPESYKTSLVWTINARSLQNFLSLRTDKSALWEIRELAYELYNKLPEEHQYLFEEFVKDN